MKLRNISQYICLIAHSIIYRMKVKPRKHYDVVIVRSDAIGDFVIWMSALPSYRKKFQGKSILLICPHTDKDLAEASGIFDEILTFDRNAIIDDVLYHIKFMYTTKTISSDIVINPTWQHQMSADYICAMIQSPQKVGTIIERKGKRDKWCDKYFTDLIGMPDLQKASEFEAIECFTQKIVDENYKYILPDVGNITSNYSSSLQGKYCCISISSSTEMKNWPNERVAEILTMIPKDFAIVLLGYGNSDARKASFLITKDKGTHIIHNYVNTTSIIDMIRIISKASFVMANDSVAVHMAAACRVRSICYTHGAHFKRFVPYPDFIPERIYHPRCIYKEMDCYGCNYNCRYDKSHDKPLFCLREVSAEMVATELRKLINELQS